MGATATPSSTSSAASPIHASRGQRDRHVTRGSLGDSVAYCFITYCLTVDFLPGKLTHWPTVH